MKLEFRGVARHVYVHRHDCINVRWKSGTEGAGTIRKAGLSGDFRVTFSFEEGDLVNWSEALVRSDPEVALRIASKMQAEAIISLSKRKEE